jgi:large subunit ribosomal protein L18
VIQGGKTIVSASDLQKKGAKAKKGTPLEVSAEVGKMIAEKALGKNISEVAFDRGGYQYHGRVKALAEAARKAGLKF